MTLQHCTVLTKSVGCYGDASLVPLYFFLEFLHFGWCVPSLAEDSGRRHSYVNQGQHISQAVDSHTVS